jgi:hypothetical protein
VSDFKVGDRVRVTFEAEVVGEDWHPGACLCCRPKDGPKIRENYLDQPGVTVEVLEPPVEVFKPGDLVRHKHWGSVYVIKKSGWVAVGGDRVAESDTPFELFTSKHYERVELG